MKKRKYAVSTEDEFWRLINESNPVTRSVLRTIIVNRLLRGKLNG